MSFCAAISTSKMKGNTQHFRHIMLSYFKKGKNTTEMQKKICAVYGEGAVTDWMCQKWFEKLCTGDFLLDDAPWSGRPVGVDSDQIETLIESSQHYTTWEIADILKISKSIKNVSFILQWKPHGLFDQPSGGFYLGFVLKWKHDGSLSLPVYDYFQCFSNWCACLVCWFLKIPCYLEGLYLYLLWRL